MRPYWRYALISFGAMIVSVLINLSVPLLTSRVIDNGIAMEDSGFVVRIALTMIGLILAGMAASALASIMGVRLAFNTITDLRRDVYAKTQTFSFGNLDLLSSGEILTRLSSDMTKVTTLLAMGLSFVAQIPIMFIGALGAIVLIDLSLVVIVLVMMPVIGIVVGYTISQSSVLYAAVQNRIDRLNTVLQENIQGAEVIKAFVRQDHETERFHQGEPAGSGAVPHPDHDLGHGYLGGPVARWRKRHRRHLDRRPARGVHQLHVNGGDAHDDVRLPAAHDLSGHGIDVSHQ